jgi:hypothetical protein
MQVGHVMGATLRKAASRSRWPVAFGMAALLASAMACSGSFFPARQVPVGTVDGGTPLIPAQVPGVTITADDSSLVAPERIEAGLVALTFRNAGKERHNLKVFRPKEGVRLEEVTLEHGLAALRARTVAYGGTAAVRAGASAQVVLELDEGTYLLFSANPGPDGEPGYAKGIAKTLRVGARAGDARPIAPVADLVVRLRDEKAPDVPGRVGAGPHLLEVVSAGTEPHQLILVRLLAGKSVEDLKRFIGAARTGTSPADARATSGTAELSPGRHAWLPVDLRPGDYVAYCDLPTGTPGVDHLLAGEYATFQVR